MKGMSFTRFFLEKELGETLEQTLTKYAEFSFLRALAQAVIDDENSISSVAPNWGEGNRAQVRAQTNTPWK